LCAEVNEACSAATNFRIRRIAIAEFGETHGYSCESVLEAEGM